MPSETVILTALGFVVVAMPAILVVYLGVPSLLGIRISEASANAMAYATVVLGLAASVAVLVLMLVLGRRHVPVDFGAWVAIPRYHFNIKLVFDRLSVPFAILTFLLCGTISAFASRYMHRETGFNRFFVLYSLFVLGMILTTLAGTVELLFAGWELVGLSSALLVAFFQERAAPVRNGLWVWIIYRLSDAALLVAAVVLHHLTGEGDFDQLCGRGYWPDEHPPLTAQQAFIVGGLLVVAAAGKSALVPFSGWLPRAMEGPTPSSAIFYGALSVHLGAFLLLRIGPVLEVSPALSVIVVGIGLLTAAFAALTGRVQTDIKSALSFASLTQVGLIVAEIGLGLRYLALIHLLGHACLRTLQFLRAPTLLQEQRSLENALGERLPQRRSPWGDWLPGPVRRWTYRFALERGYLDAILHDWIALPFQQLFRWCDRLERAWTGLLSRPVRWRKEATPTKQELVEELIS